MCFKTLLHNKGVTLGRKFNLPEPWIPHLWNGDVAIDRHV